MGFKSVFDLFRPTQQVVVSQPQSTTPTAGASAPIANTANEAPDPLDSLKSLWQTDPNAKGPVDPFATPLVNTDVAKLKDAAGRLDLVGGIAPELMQRAMSGTDPAAFAQVLNAAAQNAVITSAQLSASTIEQATARNNERLKAHIPNQIKQAQITSHELDNPILQHPASQPFVNMTRQQIALKNPGMSAAEINAQTERALVGFAEAVSQAPQEMQQQRQAAQGTDWDKWAGIADHS